MVCGHVMEPWWELSFGWGRDKKMWHKKRRHNTAVITMRNVSQKLSDMPSRACGSQEGTESTR